MRALLAALILIHSADRPDLDNWFMHLRAKSGAICCDMTEAEKLTDVQWDTKDGHFRVFIDNEWFVVPDSSVVLDPNRYGQAMVWPQRDNGKVIFIRCFIPGAGT